MLDTQESKYEHEARNMKKQFSVETTKDSALSEHTKTCQKGIDWDNFCTLSAQPFYYRRAVMESLEIQREEVCNSAKKQENIQISSLCVS